MTVLDRVLGRQPLAVGLNDPSIPLTSEVLLDALHIPTQTASSIRVDESKALTMPAVWRATNLIAGTLAALPLHAYKPRPQPNRSTPSRQLQTTGSAADLLSSPHPDMTAFELWELVAGHVALWGNGYLQILRDETGTPRELWPIHPSRVKPGRTSDREKVYEIEGRDPDLPATDRQVLHIPGFGYDGLLGLSPIMVAARQGIGMALAAEEYGAKLFGSGSLAGGILTTKQRLKTEQADALKKRWKGRVGGLDNAHDIAVLDAGTEFQQLTIAPEAAQFLQSRVFQVEEISRIFGIPPHLLMSMEKNTSWGTGIGQMTLGWVKFGLAPWVHRFEQRISRVLAPGSVYARYSLEGLLRGDSAERAAFYNTMWNLGVFSTNDIRELEDLEPVEGGDVRYRPLNMGQLGTTETTTAPADDPAKETADAA